ncbi:hypothetical protein Vadar_007694 [Vaccinium darrowii]|uniref:Uncharacterized protein n=1 Tax=Vaccinium darrowii TaxID=229202 RepID=A0ACB7ZK71_9ERIC|nr:hypothetical protein Vadar_007694 [Vaccinium darrowii]
MNRDKRKWGGESSRGAELCRGLIPGPAGLVQMAMERRDAGEGVLEMNTQQAIHRVLTVESEDTAFVHNNAWLAVVHGGYMQEPGYTNLATVHKMKHLDRVKLVVAFVKSCVRDGLGGARVELKDPTGSVSGFVAEKADEVFLGKIKAGVCLVMREIVIWRPHKTTCLNITSFNLEAVFEE